MCDAGNYMFLFFCQSSQIVKISKLTKLFTIIIIDAGLYCGKSSTKHANHTGWAIQYCMSYCLSHSLDVHYIHNVWVCVITDTCFVKKIKSFIEDSLCLFVVHFLGLVASVTLYFCTILYLLFASISLLLPYMWNGYFFSKVNLPNKDDSLKVI